MSLTLGIHSGHESSAVLYRDGKLVAAICEERLSRIKNDGGVLPERAIARVLEMGGVTRADINRVALLYTFFPDEYVVREKWGKELERKLTRWKRSLTGRERPHLLVENLRERLTDLGKSFEDHFLMERFKEKEGFVNAECAFYDHHRCHAIPAAVYSGFDEAAVFTCDGNGDYNVHHTSSIWKDGVLTRKHESNGHGASAGHFYSHITQILGYRPMRHEGKIIGLAAHGDPQVLYEPFKKALRLSPDGLTVDSDFVGMENAEQKRYAYLEELAKQHSREDVSAATQQVLEDVLLELVRNFLDATGMTRVAADGGVFANVKLNQRIAALPGVESIFVFPPMTDAGNAIGAALFAEQDRGSPVTVEPLDSVYWGPEYDDDAVKEALDKAGLTQAKKLSEDDLVKTAAAAMHGGKVVGWYQGRMEYGPRALGNRSIVGAPTDPSINDWLNERLNRTEFMPFAPSVLEEHGEDLFENLEPGRHTARFMTVTYDVKKHWLEKIPAVVHVDGTARPQLVNPTSNPLYYKLISAYHALSGIPVVLNTSFNAHEEPIVCAPGEAIRALVEKRIDCLGIGSYWVE